MDLVWVYVRLMKVVLTKQLIFGNKIPNCFFALLSEK